MMLRSAQLSILLLLTNPLTNPLTDYPTMPHPPAFISPCPRSFTNPNALRPRQNVTSATLPTPNHPLSKVAAATAAALAATIISTTPPTIHHPLPIPPAQAARNSGTSFLSGSSGAVNKDPESLLRWSLPVSNKPVREIQAELEASIADLKGLKWSKIEQHIRRTEYLLNNQTAKILTDVPGPYAEEAAKLLATVAEQIPPVESALQDRNTDKLTDASKNALRTVGELEQLMVRDFPFSVPNEYAGLPQLKGRATVEMVVKKADGEPFDIEGTLYKQGNMTLVLDGYSAPVSAGSFLDLVNKGFYNENAVIRSDGFIIQAGKPKDGEGYIDKSGVTRSIPLEVFAKGDKLPTYGITLEEDGRGATRTVLPFSAYGTLAMARAEFEPNTASSQFFWFLFEPDLTPAGRNLMDGSWAVFGYTTKGEKFLKGLQKGDVIVSAKVVDGLQNLVT